MITEIATLNIGSRPASRTKTRPHRGSARHPLGVQLGAVPADAARLVRLRHGREGLAGGHPDDGLARAAGHVPRLAVLPHAAVEHGHGAVQERHRHRVALRRPGAPTRRCATPSSPASAQEWEAHASTRCSPSPGRAGCWRTIPLLERSIRNRFPYLDPLNHVQVELLKAPSRGDARTSGAAGHPAHASTASRRGCATAGETLNVHGGHPRRRAAPGRGSRSVL